MVANDESELLKLIGDVLALADGGQATETFDFVEGLAVHLPVDVTDVQKRAINVPEHKDWQGIRHVHPVVRPHQPSSGTAA